jgi:uncharacterized membrane protein
MTHINWSGWMPVFAAWAALGLAGSNANAQCYEYEVAAVIEHPGCGIPSVTGVLPRAINDHGQVVGLLLCFGNGRAFLWDAGEITVLPNPPGFTESEASDINNAGQITVGGFIWENNQYTDLTVLPDVTMLSAEAINDHGQVTGSAGVWDDGIPTLSTILWEDGQLTILAPLISERSNKGVDINNNGVIQGEITGNTIIGSEMWTMTGSHVDIYTSDVACHVRPGSMNENNQFVGRYFYPVTTCDAADLFYYRRAFLLDQGVIEELPLLPGDDPQNTSIFTG